MWKVADPILIFCLITWSLYYISNLDFTCQLQVIKKNVARSGDDCMCKLDPISCMFEFWYRWLYLIISQIYLF
jgi:hypothetical protein